MRVLFFGSYDPSYSRNRVLLKGLRSNGVEVQECRVKAGFGWSFRLLARYLGERPKYDVMVVGFPGQKVMFLARLLSGKPIIFDAFTSHYGGYILDRKKSSPTSLRAKWYMFLDRASCRLADVVLLDTNAHIDFFISEFKLERKKFHRIFVGADSSVFQPRMEQTSSEFRVHFHGHFIPLQGTEYIIRAAKILESENISFQIIGRGQEYKRVRLLGESLGAKNIRWIDSVPYEKLPEYIAQADVCLGIFGDTPKTPLVIPNKIYEALAMGKPVITADTPAARELLSDKINVLLCRKADPGDMADKIKILKEDRNLRESIGRNARELFQNNLRESILGKELISIIHERVTLSK